MPEEKKNNLERPHKAQKSKTVSILTAVLLTFVALVLLVGGSLYYLSNRMLNRIERVEKSEEVWLTPEEVVLEPEEADDTDPQDDTIVPEDVVWTAPTEVVKAPKVTNILLIGEDRRGGEIRARSDSMILCSINEDTNKITLTSFMRDMYVPFPGDYLPSRMNHAFAWGGMSMLDQVIEDNFGVTIDGNVVVDFQGFIQVMDLIAPVEIELKDYEVGYMNRGTAWALHTGTNALTGEQLLKYARIRHVGHADWERTERQRTVLTQVFAKTKDMSLKDMTALAEAALTCLTTDLSNADILRDLYIVVKNHMTIGETHRLPVDGTYSEEIIYGMAVLVPDLQANSDYLHQYILGE